MTKFEALLATARDTDAYWQNRVRLQAATQLQDLLTASGLNQEQLAQKVGVKPPQVSRVLNALGNPTLDTLVKMAGALGYVPHLTFVPIQNPTLNPSSIALAPKRPASALRRKPLKDAQIKEMIKA
jgi:transcriptional regulator with XRE-family HTH domain